MEQFLDQAWFGNTVRDYFVALGIILLPVIILPIFSAFTNKIAGDADWKKPFKSLFYPVVYLGAIYLGVSTLDPPKMLDTALKFLYIAFAIYFAAKIVIYMIVFFVDYYIKNKGLEETSSRFKPILSFINFVVWIVALLLFLDNVGVEISTIIATIGIGGLAIAFAAQAILGDLFSYFVIAFDRPFGIGDFLLFDDKVGVVEKIGIKSTRLRTMQGEELIISNSNLLNARIHNFKSMQKRRVVFSLGLVYGTPAEKLKQVPSMIKEIIESNENATFDRSHFKSYGASSLDFETVYFVQSSDYVMFMDIQQQVNLAIYEKFEQEGLEFAYPTQTIFIEKSDD